MRRLLLLLALGGGLLAPPLRPEAVKAPAGPSPYQRIGSSLEALAAGPREPLRIAIEVLVLGEQGDSALASRLAEAEKAELRAMLEASLPGGSSIVPGAAELRPFPSLPAPSELAADAAPPAAREAAILGADDRSLCGASKTPALLIVLRIVDYHSGGYDLYEATGRLLDVQSGRELARDVAWRSLKDGKETAGFLDGLRKQP